MKWQYYLDNSVDGKCVGWHSYNSDGGQKLEAMWAENNASGSARTTYHLQSGFFKYEVSIANMTQRNMTSGTVRGIRRTSEFGDGSSSADGEHLKKAKISSLQLEQLFAGGWGHIWEPVITPVIEKLGGAESYLGPARDKSIMPVRELTFQALKPNKPAAWRVIIIGQNPYPRMDSATGVAMFDASIKKWEDSEFGKAASMRSIIKAAAMERYDISSDTKVKALRGLLNKKNIVTPPEWFQAVLSQGALLLNAALTVGGDGKSNAAHNKFWRPVVQCIIEEILAAKAVLEDGDELKGLLLLWWGGEALKTKKVLAPSFAKYQNTVQIRHISHANPAAHGEKFCKGEVPHFSEVNRVLVEDLGQQKVNWLPDVEWLNSNSNAGGFGDFISETTKLHAMYLERIQVGLDTSTELEPIEGVLKMAARPIAEACTPLGLQWAAKEALDMMKDQTLSAPTLTADEIAAIVLYTGNSLYSRLNEALRSPNREKVRAYYAYLLLFLRAHDKLPSKEMQLYRGIGKNLSSQYAKGKTVTWWNVSSCTDNIEVARGFGGGSYNGTLFHVKSTTAVPIMHLSMYKGEDEYVLAPGTQIKVVKVLKGGGKAPSQIFLEEIGGDRLVN